MNMLKFTEHEMKTIKLLEEQDICCNSINEYILSLVADDKKNYREVEAFAVCRGINKDKEPMEKGRKSLGIVLAEDDRISFKSYQRLIKEAVEIFGNLALRPQHYTYIEINGKKLEPASMASFVMIE